MEMFNGLVFNSRHGITVLLIIFKIRAHKNNLSDKLSVCNFVACSIDQYTGRNSSSDSSSLDCDRKTICNNLVLCQNMIDSLHAGPILKTNFLNPTYYFL